MSLASSTPSLYVMPSTDVPVTYGYLHSGARTKHAQCTKHFLHQACLVQVIKRRPTGQVTAVGDHSLLLAAATLTACAVAGYCC